MSRAGAKPFLAAVGVEAVAAAAASAAALALMAKVENRGALQPLNATSHWLNGEAVARRTRAGWRTTGVGVATHLVATAFWAAIFEGWLRRGERNAAAVVGKAAVMAGVSALVDYRATPKRFTPGWEFVLSAGAMGVVYAALGAGLAGGRRPGRRVAARACGGAPVNEAGLPPGSFARVDEGDDRGFYAPARLVSHIDEGAVAALSAYYGATLTAGASVLDLMSSWISHLPPEPPLGEVIGHGMNAEELAANPRLTRWWVQDLNRDARLPLPDAALDAALCCVGVQYLQRPFEVFAEVKRALRPSSPFVVSFSSRCFPTKAVAIWRALDVAGHAALVERYLLSAGFGEVEARVLADGVDGDPPGGRHRPGVTVRPASASRGRSLGGGAGAQAKRGEQRCDRLSMCWPSRRADAGCWR